MIQKVIIPTCNPILLRLLSIYQFIKGVGKCVGGGGGGLGGGAKATPNLWVKENNGKKKHPTNKKGYPSQTLPY